MISQVVKEKGQTISVFQSNLHNLLKLHIHLIKVHTSNKSFHTSDILQTHEKKAQVKIIF